MSAVGNKQCSVVLHKCLLQLVLLVLIDEFLVVCDNALCDSLSDGIDLGSVASTGDADTDVNKGELVESDNKEGLVNLSSVSFVSCGGV